MFVTLHRRRKVYNMGGGDFRVGVHRPSDRGCIIGGIGYVPLLSTLLRGPGPPQPPPPPNSYAYVLICLGY